MYIFEYKELIKNLVISDLKTKYSNSALGFVWSMLNPLLMMLVLYLVFNNVFRNNQEHFALYILIGLTGWRFFALGYLNGYVLYRGKIKSCYKDLHTQGDTHHQRCAVCTGQLSS